LISWKVERNQNEVNKQANKESHTRAKVFLMQEIAGHGRQGKRSGKYVKNHGSITGRI
jgi:hypothetical protein